MLRRTPLFDRHQAAGARFVPFAGWEMPVQYTGLTAEHKAVRASVGLFDVSHMGEARFRGRDAAAVVDWLTTNDVIGLPVGQARYGLMCNERGGVVDDVVAYRIADDDVLVCINAANCEKDVAWMREHLPAGADVTLEDESGGWAQIAVQGRGGEATVQPLTPVELAGMKPWRVAEGSVAGVAGCILARTGYTGEDGFELFVPAHGAGKVWDALMEAGAPLGVVPVGLGARDTLRLEARLSLYGHELTDETSPGQARLMRFVKLDKPAGFLGAEAVAARRETDEQVLVGAVIDDRRIVREGMAVVEDGVQVGTVTSGTLSPMLEKGVCLAYVPRRLDVVGATLTFDVRGRTATGTVVKGPFFTPDYRRKSA
jgi:aminomethyltransferase